MQSLVSRIVSSPRVLTAVASLWLVYFVFGTTSGFGLDATWHDEQRFLQTVLLAITALALLALAARAAPCRPACSACGTPPTSSVFA